MRKYGDETQRGNAACRLPRCNLPSNRCSSRRLRVTFCISRLAWFWNGVAALDHTCPIWISLLRTLKPIDHFVMGTGLKHPKSCKHVFYRWQNARKKCILQVTSTSLWQKLKSWPAIWHLSHLFCHVKLFSNRPWFFSRSKYDGQHLVWHSLLWNVRFETLSVFIAFHILRSAPENSFRRTRRWSRCRTGASVHQLVARYGKEAVSGVATDTTQETNICSSNGLSGASLQMWGLGVWMHMFCNEGDDYSTSWSGPQKRRDVWIVPTLFRPPHIAIRRL